MHTRRHFLQSATGAGAALGLSAVTPVWAKPAGHGNMGVSGHQRTEFDLKIGKFPVTINGRSGQAIGVNGGLPGPLLRFREGDDITLNVTNNLMEDSSIHWHGLLVPFYMDGVPGVSFPGIKPGAAFSYKFAVPQNGTYWYHSHSGLQEQLGHYGPIIIDPKGADPVAYDREYIMVLSDWSFENPHRIFAKLKKMSDSYNYARLTFAERMKMDSMWQRMRMSPRDITDVGGSTYTYLINGKSTTGNWNGVFNVGERVRLRIINASAMTQFNVRIPGLPMTIVQSDGLNVRPHEIDEFQIGVAETYDVIIEPTDDRAYAFVAESIDRSGQVVATLAPEAGMRAAAPSLRDVPTLGMIDMAMDHGSMTGMDREMVPDPAAGHSRHDMGSTADTDAHNHQKGPGVTNNAMAPQSRLHEPGVGLENVPHRTLRYSDLRSLVPNPDTREHGREIELHLTSNMERYMWSFDGVKFVHVKKPIMFYEGERVRLTMINDTMMPHPIHLHGMYFDLVNGADDHKPRKHTVIVKPGEKLSVDITADAVGDWAFHCHLLFHMHAGMMQVVSVLPSKNMEPKIMHHDDPRPEKIPHEKIDHSGMNHGEMK